MSGTTRHGVAPFHGTVTGYAQHVVSYGAEQRVHVPSLTAQWLTQTFVHWPFPPEQVQRLLPEGLTVDEYDGAAWVGMTPLVMAVVRPGGLVAPHALAAFPETNLRTFVRGPDGRDGLWFLGIDVDRTAMLAARLVGAPYHLGRLAVETEDGGTVTYTGYRRRGGPSYRMVVRPGDTRRPRERDLWLIARWRAYTRRFGRLWETPVEHEPWQLASATVEYLRESLMAAAGLPQPTGEPVAHFSEGVRHVRLGLSRPVPKAPAPA